MSDREYTLTWTFRDGTTTNDVLEWARKFEEDDYRVVARDVVGTTVVSTIWQGMPSVFGAPNNYETAVFDSDEVVWQMRWHTENEAVAGHAMALLTVEQGRAPKREP